MADKKVTVIYKLKDKATKGFKSLGRSIKNVTKNILSSKVAIAALATGTLLAIKSMVDGFSRFETAMVNVGNLTFASRKEVREMARDILELSKTTPSSLDDLTASLFDVVSAGVSAGDAVEFLGVASKLAMAGVTTTSVAVDGLTSVLNAYSLESSDALAISDKFFAAQQAGKTTIEELATNIGNIAPIANGAGVEISELLAALSSLTAQGIKTNQATTGLKRAIAAIIAPSEQAKEKAEELGIEFNQEALEAKGLSGVLKDVIKNTDGNVESIVKLFGSIEGVNSVLALSNNEFKKLDETLIAVKNSTNATTIAFGNQAETVSFQFDILKNKVRAISTSIVDYFSPAILGVLKGLNKAITITTKFLNLFKVGLPGATNEALEAMSQLQDKEGEVSGQIIDNLEKIKNKDKEVTVSQIDNLEKLQKLRLDKTNTFFKSSENKQKESLKKQLEANKEFSEETLISNKEVYNELAASFSQMSDGNVNVAEAAAKAVLRLVLRSALASMKAKALAETAKATIGAPLSFGATLLALAPIAAAHAAGIAAINSIKLAGGGIIEASQGGTLATIGEGGRDEAVIPLDSKRGREVIGSGKDHIVVELKGEGMSILTKGIYKRTTQLLRQGQIQER